jgi:hypothetical protein
VRLDDPRDLKRVPGRLQRNRIVAGELCANSVSAAGSVCTRPRQPHRTRLRDRHLAEVAMHV